MNKVPLSSVVVALMGIITVYANDTDERKQIGHMELLLRSQDICSFSDSVIKGNWKSPHIPSRWHVDRISDSQHKMIDEAAREMGATMADTLNELPAKLQSITDNQVLYRYASSLLRLSQWCGEGEGYGNLFLAQRCLDLGAVITARLAADLAFPISECRLLFHNLDAPWASLESRMKVLNTDAQAEIFRGTSQEDLEATWSSGVVLKREADNPELIEIHMRYRVRAKLKSPEIMSNLPFFDDVDFATVKNRTLVGMWNLKWHEGIVLGLELQNVTKARALIQFRDIVGSFPDKPIFAQEDLSRRAEAIKESGKLGNRVVPFEAGYSSVQEAAFAQAWEGHVKKQKSAMPPDSYSRYLNQSVIASRTYDEVRRGVFVDKDTRQTMGRNAAPEER